MVDEHHGFLWIKGKPGAGKSTLMKFILSNARRRMKDKTIISFFFNARGEELEKSTTGMYRSLLLQMLQQLPRLHSLLDPGLILGIGENHDWSVEALRTLFEQTLEGLGDSSVVVFIDALDECDESGIRSMVSSFKNSGNLSAAEGVGFQVCLASRHYPHITMPKRTELVLEGQEGHDQDIISYLDSELEIGDSKLAQEVRAQIKEKASGVFMWVVLVSGILQQKYDQGRIHTLKQTLREIPGDLHELFRDILTRDDANKDELLLCIQWVLFARNPLKLEQLYFAIRSHTERTTCKWDRDEIGELAIRNFILSSSKGLVEVTRLKNDPTVQFIHESVRDFLLKDNGLREILMEENGNLSAESHDQLKKCCFEYMQSYTEEDGALVNNFNDHLVEVRVVADFEFPFLRYAAQNILYHANAAEEGHISQARFLESFPLAKWIQHNNVFQDKEVRRHTITASLLYLLAEYNFGSLIEGHQRNQSCFDIENERYGAPILAAIATDDDLIVASFAIASSKAYTYINLRTPRGETPFSVAIQHSHDISATLGFLIENGARIESRDQLRRTPLCLAAANGDTAAVAFLLENGANVQKTCIHGKTPLPYAAGGGSEECMRLLISGGASVAATDDRGQTALFQAACSPNESEAKMQLLIGHGADVHRADNSGRTPLSHAARLGAKACQLLLDHGADVNAAGNRGKTPLSYAASSYDPEAQKCVQLLLDRGAIPDIVDGTGNTALSNAATDTVRALLSISL
ncbi:Serine/threonine-protein phosphatase 6 regulatory ankyrin repeat subunit C [Fusarium odoratissimum]|uniref:Serine/threonine-protein phosphatase 6 regulatory ankyrin repeat subunit C n=1 Tax=Fusarium oxysporum f. sp. cubense (strain race 4) TaxID=2502994 RepID=N1RLD5_FUSC4|nr:Serine/threonine-protein phosphatase 6 regulatory ankyrin repeat subunit C [Fusarium odoratissimum]